MPLLSSFGLVFSQDKRTQILIGILSAFLLSAFIYLEYFFGDSNYKPFSSLFAILGLFLYLNLSRFGAFICGALIGILWFYWVALSFRFYDLTYLMPAIWLTFIIIFGFLFFLFCYFQNPLYKISTLLISSFIHPFGFNWFIPEIILTKSYFFPSKSILFLLLITLAIFTFLLHKRFYKIGISLLLFALIATSLFSQTLYPKSHKSTLKIKTTSTNIPQNLRWDLANLNATIQSNLNLIQKAKQENYDLVILPETAFPMALNTQPSLIQSLKNLSQDIMIITGGVNKDKNNFYNSAYIFQQGKMEILNKVILVPFGEKIPLPDFIAHWINEVFFKGGNDFASSLNKTPNSTILKDHFFQIAICYEATRVEYYQNSPKFLIAISNNAWFYPSIESTLQKLLMQYFAFNYGTTIYHSSNGSKDFVLLPNQP